MTRSTRVQMSRLSLALIAALAMAPAFAQSTSSGLSGTVTGADGKPVAGAEVTITHVESGTVRRATTDANGRYTAQGLRVGGPYTISVHAAAGDDTENGVFLSLNQVATVNAQLGGAAGTLDTVTVVAKRVAPVFNSKNTGLGFNISGRQLQATPQGNRSIDDIARLDPRIQVTDQGDGSISANGLPNRYNDISVDGMSQGDPYGLNANGMPYTGSPISPDTIAAYNIATTDFDVTSNTVGADINAVTKSGTNEFHGSVYMNYRKASDMVGKLNGNEYTGFDRDRTYGFTVGGPIVKDKLFFFLSAEKETANGIGADSTNGLTTGQISQADLDQVIQTAQTLGLQPGGFSGGGVELRDERYLAKLDWNINDRHRASLTYQRTKEAEPIIQGNGFNSVGLNSYWYTKNSLTENTSLQLFDDWSDTFSTEAKVSYQKFSQLAGNAINQPNVRVYLGNSKSAPYVYLGEDEFRHENAIATKKWSVYLAGTWYVGDHAIKGGFDWQRNDIYNLFGRTEHGAYEFLGLTNFANGIYDSYRLYQPAPGYNLDDIAAIWVFSQFSPFLQDTWQVNDKLTLTYGVRVDIPDSNKKPLYNACFASDPVAPGTGPANCPNGGFGYRNDNAISSKNRVIEPRFAFNYTFDTERPTQLRGGIGLFQTVPPTVWMSNPYQNNGLTVASYSSFDPATTPFSSDPYNQNIPPGAGSISGVVDTIDPDFKLPTVWKTSLAFDHELPWWGLVGSIEWQYLKNKDAIFYQAINIGAPSGVLPDGRLQFWKTPGEFPSSKDANFYRNKSFDAFSTLLTNTDKGHANSLTFALSKPFADGWSGNISATFARSKEVNPGNSSQASSGYKYVARLNPNDEYADTADRSIDTSLKASLNWEHAFFGDYRTTVSAYYNGRTGLPYTWIFSGDANGDGITYEDPVYIPLLNDPMVSYGTATQTQIDAFNAFIDSDPYLRSHRGQIAGHNDARMPWSNQFDLGLQQEIPGFMKGHKGIVRLDIFNFLNLLNNDWGVSDYLGGFNTRTLAGYSGVDPGPDGLQGTADDIYKYYLGTPTKPQWQDYSVYDAGRNPTRTVSRWSVLLTLKYTF